MYGNPTVLLMAILFSCVMVAQEAVYPENGGASDKDLTLYPNPASDDVVFVNTGKNIKKDITIFNVFGKVVLRQRIFSNSLNIAALTPGVYVMQVTEGKKSLTRKLVVK